MMEEAISKLHNDNENIAWRLCVVRFSVVSSSIFFFPVVLTFIQFPSRPRKKKKNQAMLKDGFKSKILDKTFSNEDEYDLVCSITTTQSQFFNP